MAGPKHGMYRFRSEWYPSEKKGKMATKTLGWATREEAMNMSAQMLVSGEHRKIPVRKTIPNVGRLLDLWLDNQNSRPGLAMNSLNSKRGSVDRLKKKLDSVPVSDLTSPIAIEDFRDDCMRDGRAIRTIALDFQTLRQAVHWGHRRDMVTVSKDDIPKVSLPIPDFAYNHRTPTNEEAGRVHLGMKNKDGVGASTAKYSLLFLILWGTGARVGSVCRLTWADIDLVRREIRFGNHRGARKTRRSRVVPMNDSIFNELSSMSPQSGRLFKCSESNVVSRIASVCEELGIDRFTPHGLRRLAVSTMIRGGVDLPTAASITGHDVKTMLKFYSEATPESRRNAIVSSGLGASCVDTTLRVT